MNIKRALAALLLTTATFSAHAQSGEDYNTVVQKIYEHYNAGNTDSIYALFSERLKTAMPKAKIVRKINDLRTRTGLMTSFHPVVEKEGVVIYTTVFSNTVLSLMIKLNMAIEVETFRFIPFQSDSVSFTPSTFFYTAPTGNIFGTLTQPPGMNKVPVVIIIPGAGPVDREGNNPYGLAANTYQMLADSLKKEGIASLRYDKRGVSESAPALKIEDDLTFDNMINDAIGFTTRLKQYWRFNKVFVLGHGEGSLIGMEVAKNLKVDGFISISGVTDRADKLLEKQIKAQSKKLAKKVAVVFDSIGKGYDVSITDSAVSSVFNESIQKYLGSWMRYSPLDEMKKVTVPVLILQGTHDLQATTKDAKKLKAACPQATLTYIEGMNYIMKPAPEDVQGNIATYSNDKLPLSPGLIPAITQFIKSAK